MRKTHGIVLLAALLALALSACGGAASAGVTEPAGTALEMAEAIRQSQSGLPPLTPMAMDSENFAPYVSSLYGIDPDTLEDGAVYYPEGVEASEIAVLAFSGQEEAQAAEEALSDYLISRADSFTGYVPEQAALVENSRAAAQGRYAALLICPDPEAAEAAFSACFAEGWTPPEVAAPTPEPQTAEEIPPESSGAPEGTPPEVPEPSGTPAEEPEAPPEVPERGTPQAEPQRPRAEAPEPPTEPPEEPPAPPAPEEALPPEDEEAAPPVSDEYDRQAVLSAWRTGDPSGLGEKNRMVYDAVSAVLDQCITQDMTDYQRELAIHDYITGHGQYDKEANSNAPDAAPDPDNDNPYGMLVGGVGICRGYASTFQLFMDLLGIECMTVEGHSGRQEHAWNMVRLDGDWYCVDVTWDDPTNGQPTHRFFNVTSGFLRRTGHQWDTGRVPEADATRWAYQDSPAPEA